MTAARIARRQSQAQQHDPIGWALFYKMDWCERHPGLMLLCVAGLIVLEGVFERVCT